MEPPTQRNGAGSNVGSGLRNTSREITNKGSVVQWQNGGMVELVDAASLNGAAFGREGSSPSTTTVLDYVCATKGLKNKC